MHHASLAAKSSSHHSQRWQLCTQTQHVCIAMYTSHVTWYCPHKGHWYALWKAKRSSYPQETLDHSINSSTIFSKLWLPLLYLFQKIWSLPFILHQNDLIMYNDLYVIYIYTYCSSWKANMQWYELINRPQGNYKTSFHACSNMCTWIIYVHHTLQCTHTYNHISCINTIYSYTQLNALQCPCQRALIRALYK